MASNTVVQIDTQGKLERLASGKVRDLFIVDDQSLLFVATDRISAYDVVMNNVSPLILDSIQSLLCFIYAHFDHSSYS